ncbi:MAG: hypothetical protein ACW98F_13385 [Candidatus Hodarchaeales archaeon]|jgi:UDP-glucose 6-dehydrogenase
MENSTHLIIGLGEVGTAIKEIIEDSENKFDVLDLDLSPQEETSFDFLHLCYPDSKNFVDITQEYIKKYTSPKSIIIIHSTINPGTTQKVAEFFPRVAYSPIRGTHPNLKPYILHFQKFVSTTDLLVGKEVEELYNFLKIPIALTIEDPRSLEFAKNLNTTFYMHLIVFTQAVAKLAKENDLNLSTITDFIDSTDDRCLLPYAQAIGGHCLIPNAKTLARYLPLAKYLIEHNEQFAAEFKDEKIRFKEGSKDPYFPKWKRC